MKQHILNVQKREDKNWELKRRGSKRASSVCNTKAEAVQEARRYLNEYDTVKELIIYKSDGSVDKIVKAKKKSQKTSSYKPVTKTFQNEQFSLEYQAWPDEALTELTDDDQGARVHVAGESAREKAWLAKVHEIGEPQWPKGGYEIRWRDKDFVTNHFFDEVMLHKSERKKRLSKKKN